MTSKATPKAKPLSASERKAAVAKATAEMDKNRKAFQGYRNADAQVRKAKKNGAAPEAKHVAAKDKHRAGHNAFMSAYARRTRLLKAS
jgi:hypothetical protein